MTATLQPMPSSSTKAMFDIATLRPGQVLTLECDGRNKWHISLTDQSHRHGDVITGVMVMTNSTNRGHRASRPPGEMSVCRHVIIGERLRINFNYTEKVISFSVSNHDNRS